jgi:multidrug efflux pump subunit AcrB
VEQLRPTLPAGVSVATWADDSIDLRQRIGLLLRNARLGLILVFLCLTMFLNLRLAFWTTMGIPISFLGGLFLVPHMDVTINMVTLFGFIVVLGIVVDDAIVVGENIYEYLQRGMKPLDAAIRGVREMAIPVTFAIATSVVAFAPILFVAGMMGKVMRQIPIVVIAVLLISLVEALLILPAHLSGDGHLFNRFFRPVIAVVEPVQLWVQRRLQWVIEHPYRRSIELALQWRYLTIAAAIALLLSTLGLVFGGFVKFQFMHEIEDDTMTARLTMPQGTPAAQTAAILQRIETAAYRTGEEFDADRTGEAGDDSPPLIRHVATVLGQQPTLGRRGPMTVPSFGNDQSHLGEVSVELLRSEDRGISSVVIANRWRELVGEVPGAVALTFRAAKFSSGDAINVQLSHRDFDTLLMAVDRLEEIVAEYPGTSDISNSFLPGKKELKLRLTPEGRALGLTLADLARQVRAGFYGEEVQRIQRGRDDIRVMVRYPETERRSLGDIDQMRIRLPNGSETPFHTVARVDEGRGYAVINRTDRRRVVAVSADVDVALANANEINADLRTTVLPQLVREFPGLGFDFEGEQREQQDALESLKTNGVVALIAIFALLAVPFRSYSQPLIIMSAIPFGLIGAVFGHMLMGMTLSLMSMFGMVALTGVVVNDSLILIDLINRERAAGASLNRAVIDSGMRRFRPIMLTTATTFLGLTPMIFESSVQAKFLQPMAVSLAYGIVFATSITLILVPALYRILEDIRSLFGIKDEEVRPSRQVRADEVA